MDPSPDVLAIAMSALTRQTFLAAMEIVPLVTPNQQLNIMVAAFVRLTTNKQTAISLSKLIWLKNIKLRPATLLRQLLGEEPSPHIKPQPNKVPNCIRVSTRH
ncbi:hypothetical protein CVS40_6391 [Lucilia cuprina]|nr:hypothetical protein CVS40_6391 [Lucilia cuprina]